MLDSLSQAIKLSRQRSKENNALSFSRQLWEMTVLYATSHLGPGNYHKYRLWQKDIPWHEKKGYWHDQRYYQFLDKVNPLTYRIVARNKVMAKALMQFYGIPDARYLGYLSRTSCFTNDGQEIKNSHELEELIKAQTVVKKLCFKPVEGSGGEGFCAVDLLLNDGLKVRRLGQNAEKSLEEFIAQDLNGLNSADYIIEEYIDQHPTLAQFNASSVNTARVWIGKTPSQGIKIVGIYLRVGRQGSLVDNRSAGGLCVQIDQNTFKTMTVIPSDGGQAFKCHPDTDFDMTDINLPFRDEVIELSRRVINVLPSTRFVGLDIAFSVHGPVLVEFNLAPMATGARVLGSSHEKLLSWIDKN